RSHPKDYNYLAGFLLNDTSRASLLPQASLAPLAEPERGRSGGRLSTTKRQESRAWQRQSRGRQRRRPDGTRRHLPELVYSFGNQMAPSLYYRGSEYRTGKYSGHVDVWTIPRQSPVHKPALQEDNRLARVVIAPDYVEKESCLRCPKDQTIFVEPGFSCTQVPKPKLRPCARWEAPVICCKWSLVRQIDGVADYPNPVNEKRRKLFFPHFVSYFTTLSWYCRELPLRAHKVQRSGDAGKGGKEWERGGCKWGRVPRRRREGGVDLAEKTRVGGGERRSPASRGKKDCLPLVLSANVSSSAPLTAPVPGTQPLCPSTPETATRCSSGRPSWTRAKFRTLLWLGYCRRCSDWTRATTRMLLELSIITSPNRVLTQCSGPIYEPHSNIVPGGCCYHQGTVWHAPELLHGFATDRRPEGCLLPATPKHAELECPGETPREQRVSPGTVCLYRCKKDYDIVMTDPSHRSLECLLDASQWNHTVAPVCKKTGCESPSPLSHSTLDCSQGLTSVDTFPPGTTCERVCDEGFTIPGSQLGLSQITCSRDGSWNQTQELRCVAEMEVPQLSEGCRDDTLLVHSRNVSFPIAIAAPVFKGFNDSNAMVHCSMAELSDYGTYTNNCTATDTELGTVSWCTYNITVTASGCPSFDSDPYSRVSCSEDRNATEDMLHPVGDVCEYICELGYVIPRSRQDWAAKECMPNGAWSNDNFHLCQS
ncbi:unnamed protein product, partial [Ixodes persulcatus]